MKQGCLIVLLIMGGTFWWYFSLLTGSTIHDQYWIPAVMALGIGLVVSNLYGIVLALKQRAACNRSRTSWKDGELVGISGMLQSNRTPITSPVSHQSAVIVEYTIRNGSTENKSKGASSYSGFLMTPCSIQGSQGVVKVIGFPMLAQLTEINYGEDEHYKYASEFLRSNKFEKRSSNIMEAFAEINKVLSDDDGDVKANFVAAGEILHESEGCEELMKAYGYQLSEIVVPNGAEVTAFGTYDHTRNAVNIGSGLKNLAHSLQLGNSSQVCSKNLMKSVIMTLVFSALFIGGNVFFFRQLGIDLVQLVSIMMNH